jgi:L-iditol 2-dehydrogenase
MCELLHRTNFDPGGFAEYVRLSPVHVERGLFVVPDTVTNEEVVFTEPLACVLRAQRVAGVGPALSVIVVGAGIAGLLHVKLARALGAERVFATDIREYRIQAAQQFGADAVWLANDDMATHIRDANEGRLADIAIVCTGSPTGVSSALGTVAPGGTLLFFAPSAPDVRLMMPFNDLFWRTDLTITTSYGASPADYASALNLIQSHRVVVGNMVTRRLGLSEAPLGFRIVAEAGDSIKVLLNHRL